MPGLSFRRDSPKPLLTVYGTRNAQCLDLERFPYLSNTFGTDRLLVRYPPDSEYFLLHHASARMDDICLPTELATAMVFQYSRQPNQRPINLTCRYHHCWAGVDME